MADGHDRESRARSGALWMFWAMLADDRLTASPWMFLGIRVTDLPPRSLRFHWTMAFLVLNVVAAGIYYFSEYKQRGG